MTQKSKDYQKVVDPITDIRHYIIKVLSNWRWFLITIPIALAYAYYVNISTQRVYGLDTVISVKEKNNPLFSNGMNIAFNWGGVSDKVESIRKILSSRSHNEKVVRKMNFYIDYLEEGRFRMEDVYGQTPFLLELEPNQFQLLNNLIKIEFFDEINYKLTIQFPEKRRQSLYNYDENISDYYQPKDNQFTVNAQLGVALNLPFLHLKLVPNPEFSGKPRTYFVKFNAVDGVVSRYKGIRTNPVSGTSLVEISLMGPNKKRLEDYLNTTVEVLAEDELKDKTNFARSTRDFIDQQFANASDSLKSIERNIGSFKEQNAIYDLSAEGQSIFQETKGLDKTNQQLSDRLQYFNNLEKYILTSKDYSKIPAPAIINIEDASIANAVTKLTELSVKKEQLTKNVTTTHPSYITVNQEIETTKNVLLENLSSLKNTTQVSINNLNKRLGTYQSRLSSLPKKEQKLLGFQRKYELTESNYIFLMQKRYEASIAIAASVSDISVLDKAKDVGQGSSLPRTQFNYLVAILLGTLIPVFIIVAIDLIDSRIYTVEEIESLSQIPVIGVIGVNQEKSNLAVFQNPKSAISESFRALRSNVQFLFDRDKYKDSKTILVTSSVGGEGKTFVSANLASVLAIGGKKTVLVGLDLRKPKLHKDFNIVNDKGVSSYLIGQDNLSDIIQKSSIENLDVITSGPVPPNPSELILKPAAVEMISFLKEKYDYVIIDSPPIGLVSDAIDLLRFADTTLYVLRHAYTKREMLKIINNKYYNQEVKNVSFILNEFKLTSKYGYSYGYSYGYGYGYGYGSYSENLKPKKSLFNKLFKKK